MFDPILVPLDGSLLAECVLPRAAALGQAFNSKIVLLHVMDKNPAGASTELIDLINWQINKTEAKQYLKRIGDRLQNSGLQAEMIVLEGPVAESITEFSQNQGVKLIVLSSHGQSGVRKRSISSITHEIILSAPTSVLIVRAHQLPEQHFRRILVPLDGSWRAENVFPMVIPLARFLKSQIQIVHVVKKPEMARHMPPMQEDIDLSDRIVARNREEAIHYLDQFQSDSRLAGIDIQTHLVISDNVNVALHEMVNREKIDLVALSAHGYSGNSQWPYGSIVNNFILYGKVPLLIVQDLPVREEANMEEKSQVYIRMREHSMH